MLQNNAQVAQIRKAVTGRVVSEIEALATKEPEKFEKFWEAFGRVIKEGIYEDHERRAQLLELARFHSTKDASKTAPTRALKDYLADMRPGQNAIYYLTGDSIDRIKSSPKLEAARARGVEVLLMSDQVDAFWTSMPNTFEAKPLKSLSQGDIDFGDIALIDDNKDKMDEPSAVDDTVITTTIKAVLGDRVSKVLASKRLTDSPACLVAEGKGPDRALEQLLAKQDRGTGAKPVLEINTRHTLVKAISDAKLSQRDPDVVDLSELLFDQARILDGEVPDDPAAFVSRVNRLAVRGLMAPS